LDHSYIYICIYIIDTKVEQWCMHGPDPICGIDGEKQVAGLPSDACKSKFLSLLSDLFSHEIFDAVMILCTWSREDEDGWRATIHSRIF